MNDQEAIVLLKSDSHEDFEYLYQVYGGQVYNFSKLYINSSEDIKEVVQEVFVKLWEARSFLREDENFRGFLFIVTRNLIFNRQKKTFNENFYKLSVLSAYEQSNIDSYNIEEELQAKELNNYIDKIIEELPPKQQEIFILSNTVIAGLRLHNYSTSVLATFNTFLPQFPFFQVKDQIRIKVLSVDTGFKMHVFGGGPSGTSDKG